MFNAVMLQTNLDVLDVAVDSIDVPVLDVVSEEIKYAIELSTVGMDQMNKTALIKSTSVGLINSNALTDDAFLPERGAIELQTVLKEKMNRTASFTAILMSLRVKMVTV